MAQTIPLPGIRSPLHHFQPGSFLGGRYNPSDKYLASGKTRYLPSIFHHFLGVEHFSKSRLKPTNLTSDSSPFQDVSQWEVDFHFKIPPPAKTKTSPNQKCHVHLGGDDPWASWEFSTITHLTPHPPSDLQWLHPPHRCSELDVYIHGHAASRVGVNEVNGG